MRKFTLLLALTATFGSTSTRAQDNPARRVASIVSVAVEEYGKAVDGQGKLISAQEFQETTEFFADARAAADRMSGAKASAARALLDSMRAAVQAKRPPASLDSLEVRFAEMLGNEGKLELPAKVQDLSAGRALYQQNCASCHGLAGQGDGPAGAALNPHPPAIGSEKEMHGASPGLMYRVVSVGVAGTPMTSFASTLTSLQRWNIVAYLTAMRSAAPRQLEGEGLYAQRCASCHGMLGAGDGTLARSLTRLPPDVGTVAYQAERSDDQLALVISQGVPGTAMPASSELSAQQIANVVAHMRTLPLKDRNTSAAPGDSASFKTAARTVMSLLEQSLSAAKSGHATDAADRAFDAYVAFEPIETPAGAKNRGLVVSMERQFGEFKSAIRAGDIRAAEHSRDGIESGMPEVLALTEPSGSGVEAFWQSFLIIVREGFEAILVIGAVVAFLIKTGHRERLKSIWIGVAVALVASAATAVLLRTVLAAVPASGELVEGLSLLLAVCVLFSVSYWLISKVEAAKWQQFIREKVNAALEQGGGRALAFVAFLAVYREGAETALFYQALFNEGPNVVLPLSLGIGVGFIALIIIFTLFYRFGVKIPLRQFFSVTSALLYYMAFVFMGKGVRELQEGNFIPQSTIPGIPHVEWLGLYPSWQGVIAQFVLVVLFAFALLKTFWPKRSVSLPTVMPAAPVDGSPIEFATMRAENDELRRRLAALERIVSDSTTADGAAFISRS